VRCDDLRIAEFVTRFVTRFDRAGSGRAGGEDAHALHDAGLRAPLRGLAVRGARGVGVLVCVPRDGVGRLVAADGGSKVVRRAPPRAVLRGQLGQHRGNTRRGIDLPGRRGARQSLSLRWHGTVRVNGGHDERADDKPLWGTHVRDRLALAMISHALDQSDATEAVGRRCQAFPLARRPGLLRRREVDERLRGNAITSMRLRRDGSCISSRIVAGGGRVSPVASS
jgi:hypothetical protein